MNWSVWMDVKLNVWVGDDIFLKYVHFVTSKSKHKSWFAHPKSVRLFLLFSFHHQTLCTGGKKYNNITRHHQNYVNKQLCLLSLHWVTLTFSLRPWDTPEQMWTAGCDYVWTINSGYDQVCRCDYTNID